MSLNQLKILLVDDNRIDVQLTQKLLGKTNLPISDMLVARSLKEAIETAGTEHIDIALLNINLPDSMGINTLTSFSKRYPEIVSVIITGQSAKGSEAQEIIRGGHEYLVKGKYTAEMLDKSILYALENKRITKVLERKQKNLEAIFDAVPVGMLLIDERRIVTRVNDAVRRLIGKGYSEIINKPIGAAINCASCIEGDSVCGEMPDCAGCIFLTSMDSVLSSGEPVRSVERHIKLIVRQERVNPWWNISATSSIIDGQKHVVLVIEDITIRKEAEEKVREAIELKSHFISTVSHELRTPLACIKEGVEIVFEGVAGKINDKQKNFLDIAKRNIDRLACLVNEVLDFQKLEAGKMHFAIKRNNINQVAHDVHKTMLMAAEKKGVNLVLDISGELAPFDFDNDKIIQVLTNLLNNSIKFTPKDGTITLTLVQEDKEMVIKVNDTGIGIPENDLSLIFERFYQSKRRGKQIKGTGIGLSIVKKIVCLHKGRIEVESRLDKGTTFTVFLPLEAEIVSESDLAESDEKLEETLARK